MSKVSVNLKNFYRNVIVGNPLLYTHQFIVEFHGDDLYKTFDCDPSDIDSFTYYVKSATIPGYSIKDQTVNFLSQDFVVPDGIQYGDSWNVTIMTTNSLKHYIGLRNWMREFADLSANGGGKKTIPNVTAHIKVLDSSMQNVVNSFTLEGVFPTKVPELQMAYENNSTIPEIQCTFTYQYMYRDENGDPLLS